VGEGVIVTELSYDPHCNGGEIPEACDRWHGTHPHCTNGPISGGCEPVAVISAEKLRDYTQGPAETAKIANVLLRDTAGMGQYQSSVEYQGDSKPHRRIARRASSFGSGGTQ